MWVKESPLMVRGWNTCNICRAHRCTGLKTFDHLCDYIASCLGGFFLLRTERQIQAWNDSVTCSCAEFKLGPKFDTFLKVMQIQLATVQMTKFKILYVYNSLNSHDLSLKKRKGNDRLSLSSNKLGANSDPCCGLPVDNTVSTGWKEVYWK